MTSIPVILISLNLFFCSVAMGQVSLEFSCSVIGNGNMSLDHENAILNVSLNMSNISIDEWNNSSAWQCEISTKGLNYSKYN